MRLAETYLTAQGAFDALGIPPGERLLIRGGTSSVGMAAAPPNSGRAACALPGCSRQARRIQASLTRKPIDCCSHGARAMTRSRTRPYSRRHLQHLLIT
jgi:hypothetical protein